MIRPRSWAHTETGLYFEEIHASQRSLQHYPQQPRHGNKPKRPLKVEWIKRCGVYIYIHTHTHRRDYYSAIKKNEIVPSAATWWT